MNNLPEGAATKDSNNPLEVPVRNKKEESGARQTKSYCTVT